MDTGKYGASDDSVTVCLKFQYGGRKTGSTCNSKTKCDIDEISAATTMFSRSPRSNMSLLTFPDVDRHRI